jgi:hypothetical protein
MRSTKVFRLRSRFKTRLSAQEARQGATRICPAEGFENVFRVLRVCLAALVLANVWTATVFAQDEKPELPSDPPIVVLSLSSFERALGGMDVAFASAGRPEMSDTVGGLLGRANDLKGFGRDKPVGLMVFLNGITPDPVAFVPVVNVDDLLKTISPTGVQTKRVDETHLELTGPAGNTLYVVVHGEYAFAASNSLALERRFPDPTKITARLSNVHDIAATINLKGLSKSSRQLFTSIMRSRADADLQQRDNEPAGAYEVRRAAAENNLRFVEEMITQGDELVFGWSVNPTEKSGVLEISLQGTPGSELAASFNELAGKKSHFAGLLLEQVPLTFSLSWNLDKSGKKTLKKMLAGMQKQMGLDLEKTQPELAANYKNPVADMFRVLEQTADKGHVDLIAQVVGQDAGTFALVGGLKVADAGATASSLASIITLLKDNKTLERAELNVNSYRGTSLHRIEGKEIPEEEIARYGGRPSVYLGAGEGVVWFAIGGDAALPALRKAMDDAARPVPANTSSSPLRFVANFNQVGGFFEPRATDEQRAKNPFRQAMAKGGDALRVEVRPIENGAKLRVQFDEAFLRLVGGEVAKGIERGEERRQRRQNQPAKPAATPADAVN